MRAKLRADARLALRGGEAASARCSRTRRSCARARTSTASRSRCAARATSTPRGKRSHPLRKGESHPGLRAARRAAPSPTWASPTRRSRSIAAALKTYPAIARAAVRLPRPAAADGPRARGARRPRGAPAHHAGRREALRAAGARLRGHRARRSRSIARRPRRYYRRGNLAGRGASSSRSRSR